MKDQGKEPETFLEKLVDASLARYRSEEPRLGLEARVLAGLRASERRARRRWVWLLAGSGVAVVFAVALSIPRHAPSPIAPDAPRELKATKPPAPVEKPLPRMVEKRTVLPHPQRVLGRQRRPGQFPTPRPLTEEEKLLLLYVKLASPSLTAGQANEQPMHDLKIPKLSIAALSIEPLPVSRNRQEN